MSIRAAAAAFLVLSSACPGLARSAPPDDGPSPDPRLVAMLGAAVPSKRCFVRRYDARHLARHPRQKVKAMRLLVYTAHTDEEKTRVGYHFGLSAAVRDRKGTLFSAGECRYYDGVQGRNMPVLCARDCDRGSFGLEVEPPYRSVLLRLGSANEKGTRFDRPGSLGMNSACDADEADSYELVSGADDRSFRLEAAPLAACREVSKWLEQP